MELRNPPIAETAMLIRRPAGEVYEAFIDPAVTSKFWFTHGSRRLDGSGPISWEWRMYGFSVAVTVKELVKDKRILLDWGDPATTAEWTFKPLKHGTFVGVRNFGFAGSADDQVKAAIDSAGGFSFVLAGAKAWLEHGIELGMVGDRFPEALPSGKA